MIRFILIALSFFILAITVSAQTPPRSLEREFFKNILKDQKAIWTAPMHLQRHNTKWVIPSSIGFMALVTTDRITGDEIGEFDLPLKTSRIISNAGSVYGLGTVAARSTCLVAAGVTIGQERRVC